MSFHELQFFNPFTPDSGKFKIDKFPKMSNLVKLKNRQYLSKVLLNSFRMNGHTLEFCPLNQNLENFFSPNGFTLGLTLTKTKVFKVMRTAGEWMCCREHPVYENKMESTFGTASSSSIFLL